MIELNFKDYILLAVSVVCFLLLIWFAGLYVNERSITLLEYVAHSLPTLAVLWGALKLLELRQDRRSDNEKR